MNYGSVAGKHCKRQTDGEEREQLGDATGKTFMSSLVSAAEANWSDVTGVVASSPERESRDGRGGWLAWQVLDCGCRCCCAHHLALLGLPHGS